MFGAALFALTVGSAAWGFYESRSWLSGLGLAGVITGNPLVRLAHRGVSSYEETKGREAFKDAHTIRYVHTPGKVSADGSFSPSDEPKIVREVFVPPAIFEMIGRMTLRQVIDSAPSQGLVEGGVSTRMLGEEWNIDEDSRLFFVTWLFEELWDEENPDKCASALIRFGAALGRGMAEWIVTIVERKLVGLGWDTTRVERQVIVALLSSTEAGRKKLSQITMSEAEENSLESILMLHQAAREMA